MRVLLVSPYFRPHVGGIERFCELLATDLAGHGHGVTVVCCQTEPGTKAEEQFDGYEVHRVRAWNALERRLGVPYPVPLPPEPARTLRRLVPAVDVVHAHEARWPLSAAALRRASTGGVPSVLTQHTAFVPQRNRALDAAQRGIAKIVARIARSATAVAVHNPEIAAWVETVWGVRGAKVLPIGVAAPPATGDRREFNLPADRFVAVFVGRAVHTKGFDLVVEALDDGYDIVAVTDAAVKSRPGLRVLPFMESDRLGRLMACVDAFLLPSRGEGFPLSLQEAMHAGLPVVTTMLPGYERFFGVTDVLVVTPDAESIRRALRALAEDRALRSHLAGQSRTVAARHFSRARFVAAYEDLYERLLANRNS